MAGSSGFRWQYDKVTPKLQGSTKRAKAYISRVTTFHALRAEGFARINAPWTDRTTNARNKLIAQADNSRASSGHWEIVIAHGVSYGFWLEVKHAEAGVGRYAIIVPTIKDQAPQYWETAQDVLQRIMDGGMGS